MNTIITTIPTTIENIDEMDTVFTIADNAHVAGIHGYCCIARAKTADLFEVYATIKNKKQCVGKMLTADEVITLVNKTNADLFAYYTQRYPNLFV